MLDVGAVRLEARGVDELGAAAAALDAVDDLRRVALRGFRARGLRDGPARGLEVGRRAAVEGPCAARAEEAVVVRARVEQVARRPGVAVREQRVRAHDGDAPPVVRGERQDLALAAPVVVDHDPARVVLDGLAQDERARLGVRVRRRRVAADAAQLRRLGGRRGGRLVERLVAEVGHGVEEARVVVGHAQARGCCFWCEGVEHGSELSNDVLGLAGEGPREDERGED